MKSDKNKAKKRKKEHFNNDIDSELIRKFDQLADSLPGKKYQIVEAAVKCFLALPHEEQLYWLLDPELQKIVKNTHKQ